MYLGGGCPLASLVAAHLSIMITFDEQVVRLIVVTDRGRKLRECIIVADLMAPDYG
jgi:hypothetical protein